MSEFPRPTLDAALADLSRSDSFKVVLDFIREEREKYIGAITDAPTPDIVMKHAGGVGAMDYLIQSLSE